MEIKHKATNNIISCSYYSHWIFKIVNNGMAYEYDILKYPDIVQLRKIQPDGTRINDKIFDRHKALEFANKFPEGYDIEEIDARKQIIKDIEKSNKIKNQSSIDDSSSESLKKSGKIHEKNKRVPIIGAIIQAIISLSPIWKIILGIIVAGFGTLLGYILIEWYKTLSYV